MQGLTSLVLSLCALFEAEGKLLQENILQTISRCLLLVIGAILAIAALAFLVAGIFDLLIIVMPRPLAFACLALICGLASFILFWSAGRWGKKLSQKAAAGKNSQV